jgi:hypothetical protein
MKDIDKIINKMLYWLEINGTAGWDPYDIQGSAFYTKFISNKGIFTKIVNRLLLPLNFYLPLTLRRLLNVKKTDNAKAHALLMLSYCNLYQIANETKYIDLFNASLNWLIANNNGKNNELAWGYPFDWHSEIFIPKGTPLCVPTVLVGHALLKARSLGFSTYDEELKKISEFLKNSLNKNYYDHDKLCFSYSPIDQFHVLNANLYTASFLAKFYSVYNCSESLDLSLKAVNFVVGEQRLDGSWGYWSDRQIPVKLFYVDNYHTGVLLQWLSVINDIYPQPHVAEALQKGLDFYVKNMFTDDGLPRQYHGTVYPLDIHAPAQFFITYCQFNSQISPEILKKVYNFVRKKMWIKEGYFAYRINRFKHKSKIPYTRWSHAWMLYALTCLKLSTIKKDG